jgi:glutamyl/glutaminyl-tRNA synthetase
MSRIIISKNDFKDFKELEQKYKNSVVIESDFIGIEESGPLVYRVDDDTFFGEVTENDLAQILLGHKDELRLQTAKIFDVEMKRYMSEPTYRKILAKLLDTIKNTDMMYDDLLFEYSKESSFDLDVIMSVFKMALIKTTKGPSLFSILEVLTKEEVIKRIEKYLYDYRYRI